MNYRFPPNPDPSTIGGGPLSAVVAPAAQAWLVGVVLFPVVTMFAFAAIIGLMILAGNIVMGMTISSIPFAITVVILLGCAFVTLASVGLLIAFLATRKRKA